MKHNCKCLALLLCISLICLTACGAERAPVPERSDTEYIFVHGLSGWGSYDKAYKRMPYWGMFGGDLMEYLRGQGFSCYAASVSPEGSAFRPPMPFPPERIPEDQDVPPFPKA